MDRKSRAPVIAKVDVSKVRLVKDSKLGIDFFNEIDIWAKMEFRSREQISKLRQNKTLDGRDCSKNLGSLHYSVREKID